MKKDQFESDLQDKMDAMEVLPPEMIWNQLEHQLNSSAATPFPSKFFYGLVAVGLITLTAMLLLLRPGNQPEPQSEVALGYDTTFVLGESGRIESFQIDTVTLAPKNLPGAPNRLPKTKNSIPEPVRTWLEDERLLLLYIRSDCKYCLQMEKETFSDPEVDQFIEDHFNMITLEHGDEKNRPFLKRNKINVSPTLLVINEAGLIIYHAQGYQNTASMRAALQAILDGAAIPGKEAADAPNFEITDQPRTFKIFPNPNRGQFTIKVNHPEPVVAKVQITTIHGQLVHEQRIEPMQGNWEQSFNLSDAQKGYYIIRIEQNGEVLVEKMLIQ